MNIQKVQNGYMFEGDTYILVQSPQIISETQADFFTNMGIVLLDTSVTIDGKSFDTIEDFIDALTNEA